MKAKSVKLYQQGDVLMFREDSIPSNAKPMKCEGRVIVLAEGETTGHYHSVEESDTCLAFKDDAGSIWMDVKAPVIVKHQEHKHVKLPKGKYRVGIVREVDPFAEEIHKVRD